MHRSSHWLISDLCSHPLSIALMLPTPTSVHFITNSSACSSKMDLNGIFARPYRWTRCVLNYVDVGLNFCANCPIRAKSTLNINYPIIVWLYPIGWQKDCLGLWSRFWSNCCTKWQRGRSKLEMDFRHIWFFNKELYTFAKRTIQNSDSALRSLKQFQTEYQRNET